VRWIRVVVGVVVAVTATGLAGCGDDQPADGDPVAFCERLDRLTTNDPFLAFGDVATAADIEAAFSALVARADELVEVAPPEPRGAALDFAEAAAALDSLMAGAAYDSAALDARAYRDEQLAYAAASDRLLRYFESSC
jgi:hypothetical protein